MGIDSPYQFQWSKKQENAKFRINFQTEADETDHDHQEISTIQV